MYELSRRINLPRKAGSLFLDVWKFSAVFSNPAGLKNPPKNSYKLNEKTFRIVEKVPDTIRTRENIFKTAAR